MKIKKVFNYKPKPSPFKLYENNGNYIASRSPEDAIKIYEETESKTEHPWREVSNSELIDFYDFRDHSASQKTAKELIYFFGEGWVMSKGKK